MEDKWIGNYTYGELYPVDMRGKSYAFTIKWTVNEGIISGSCIEEESKNIFSEPIPISGFIEKKFISFIKKYPHPIAKDDNLQSYIKENEPPLEIHYSGNFIDRHFEGIWQLTLPYIGTNGRKYNRNLNGTWTMRRIKDSIDNS